MNFLTEATTLDAAKILIVDDEKFVRRTISRVLSSEGFATFEASNGPDALRMAQEPVSYTHLIYRSIVK